MRGRRFAVVSLVALSLVATVPVVAQRAAAPPAAASARVTALPEITYTRFSLPNGLRVILHEDHSTPVVAVNVWYHVGSKNESAGRTGFAHLFEHMMFQGFQGYPYAFGATMDELGASRNGSTNTDRTNYFEVVPSNFLETALFMEAGRMGRLLETVTQERLDNQRDVVKNEKRQRDRQPALRPGVRPDHVGALSARAPLQLVGDRVHGGSHGRLPRRRLGVLSHATTLPTMPASCWPATSTRRGPERSSRSTSAPSPAAQP